jgi:hypothetical protein
VQWTGTTTPQFPGSPQVADVQTLRLTLSSNSILADPFSILSLRFAFQPAE